MNLFIIAKKASPKDNQKKKYYLTINLHGIGTLETNTELQSGKQYCIEECEYVYNLKPYQRLNIKNDIIINNCNFSECNISNGIQHVLHNYLKDFQHAMINITDINKQYCSYGNINSIQPSMLNSLTNVLLNDNRNNFNKKCIMTKIVDSGCKLSQRNKTHLIFKIDSENKFCNVIQWNTQNKGECGKSILNDYTIFCNVVTNKLPGINGKKYLNITNSTYIFYDLCPQLISVITGNNSDLQINDIGYYWPFIMKKKFAIYQQIKSNNFTNIKEALCFIDDNQQIKTDINILSKNINNVEPIISYERKYYCTSCNSVDEELLHYIVHQIG